MAAMKKFVISRKYNLQMRFSFPRMSNTPRCPLSVTDEGDDQVQLAGCSEGAPSKSALTHDYLFGVLGATLRDVESCDLLCSLFAAALTHYRRDTVLRPFPPAYVSDGPLAPATGEGDDRKRFESLTCVMKEMPPLPFIVQQSQIDNRGGIMSNECTELLLWILDTKGFALQVSNDQTFSRIKELTGQIGESVPPTHIFEVIYSPDVEEKFQLERNGRDCIYAYHGSRIENFHSILHNGLCNHMNKNSLFGQGTYLSSELSICMQYSPTGGGWNRSILGANLSCVAVCEVINHSDVRCHTRNSKTSALEGSLSGEDVPEKYYIVQNDELVRVKYLLVFVETNKVKSRLSASRPDQRMRWFANHKSILLMMVYVFLLAAIGFSNSRPFKMFLKKYIWWPQ